MPRANRYFLPGHVWHITHRCHKQEFLLKFSRDRQNWIRWLYEARKRYGLCVLNYMVTSNHIHLLVKDTGKDIIPRSMQLIAGRTAQDYNLRKHRKGAFWEDRYHATAVEAESHLFQCLVYIDLNMVRAGVVAHPADWPHCGYHEIRQPPSRYRIIDIDSLLYFANIDNLQSLQNHYQLWIDKELNRPNIKRDACWTESLAVGREAFIKQVKHELGYRGKGRSSSELEFGYQLKEVCPLYIAKQV